MFDSGYCINTGAFGAKQATNGFRQPCELAQVGSDQFLLSFGLIGNVAGAILRLGTPSMIRQKYNIDFPVNAALKYVPGNPGLVFEVTQGQINMFQNDTDTLLTTSQTCKQELEPALVGEIFIVRFTSQPVTTTTIGDSTTAIIVGLVAGYDNYTLNIQWGVIASQNAAAATLAAYPRVAGGYLSTTYGIAVTALLFSLFLIIVLFIAVAIWWKGGRGGFLEPLLPSSTTAL